jgi:uncharacterized protein YpiB (UPF0302 family)
MLLNEFFGNYAFKTGSDNATSKEDAKMKEDDLCNDVFEYIINNDKLHKEEFFPIAEKVVREATKEHNSDLWMPMANKGCMQFYKENKMKEDPKKIFTMEMRKELCSKIAEHYQGDILKGIYNLGK